MTDNLPLDEMRAALFACQNDDCACEVSYPARHLRLHDSKPICEDCYDELPIAEKPDDPEDPETVLAWWQLSAFEPFADLIAQAEVARTMRELLREAKDGLVDVDNDHGQFDELIARIDTTLGRKDGQ